MQGSIRKRQSSWKGDIISTFGSSALWGTHCCQRHDSMKPHQFPRFDDNDEELREHVQIAQGRDRCTRKCDPTIIDVPDRERLGCSPPDTRPKPALVKSQIPL